MNRLQNYILNSKIWFQVTRLSVMLYVISKNIIQNPWKKVQGIYLPLSPAIGFNTLRWIVNGKYESDEISIVDAKLEAGDIVLEIGTGLGFIAAFCAKRTGSDRVFTFEANPLNVATARNVFLKNEVAPVLQHALLSNHENEKDFPVDHKSRLASSLMRDKKDTITVETLDLNACIARIQPDFIAMDIEGAEYEIFNIIRFQTIKKVQFELHPQYLDEQQCLQIFNILESNSFIKDDRLSINNNYYYSR